MRFRQGFLEGSSRRGPTVSSVMAGEYDCALLVGSWDQRCLAITRADNVHIREAIVLSFRTHDTDGMQQANEKAVLSYLRDKGTIVSIIDNVSEDVEIEWRRIWARFKQVHTRQPLSCVLDLATCPRYYSMGLVAAGFSTGLAGEFTALYPEGTYGTTPSAVHPLDVPFSIGRWNTVPIPFLQGHFAPSRKRFYLVSVGFEGTKTERVLSRDDPDRISILYPIPGVQKAYEEEVRKANMHIVEKFCVPASQIVEAPASDAIAVWRTLSEADLERFDQEDVYYLCCGTKAHSLGLSLRALALGSPTVLYTLPERHNFVDVTCNGVYCSFNIRDVSAPVMEHQT